MPRKYVYKSEYVEKNENITHRRCKTCKEMKEIKDLENSFTCKFCYTKNYGLKRCNKCHLLMYVSEFHKNYTYKDGLLPICKYCKTNKKLDTGKLKDDDYMPSDKDLAKKFRKYLDTKPFEKYTERYRKYNNHYSALRRARIRNACPNWVDLNEIHDIYKNRPDGYHVDHIVPIKNDIVCGLHVPWNLQYLPIKENIAKSNKLS